MIIGFCVIVFLVAVCWPRYTVFDSLRGAIPPGKRIGDKP